MPTYNWSGINSEGKKIQGTDQANNCLQLKQHLAKKKILLLKSNISLKSLTAPLGKTKAKQITYFIEQLSILINANTPIIKALTIISQDECSPKLKTLIISCKKSITEGKTLCQTWQQHPLYFTSLMCSIANIGEQSGTLDIMLYELANHLKKMEAQKHKIIKALLYPISILLVTVITTIILLVFVIPQFETMFESLGAKLPNYTQFIIKISILLQKLWPFTLAGIIIIIISLKISYKYLEKFRIFFDRLTLTLPLLKNISTYAYISRLTKTLGLTLKSGVSLLDALNISTTIVPNRQYQTAIQKTIKLIINGQSLSGALQAQNLFPTKMIQLISLGEETGSLDVMLEKIAVIYNEKLNDLSDNLNNLLEPIIMLILGVIVGGLVIGMYLPIFRLGSIV